MTDQATRNAELIERYISAVEYRLPAKGAKDIVAELRQAIGDKLEAKEAELGHTAGKEDVVAIIKSFGSPMLASARYTGAQHLIGPEVYPYFWPTARIVVGVVAAVAIVGFLVQGVVSDEPVRQVLRGLSAAWTGSLIAFGIVTAIFVAMDRAKSGLRIEEKWRPDQLPRFSRLNKPKSLFESLFSLAWDAVFIAWWVGLLRFSNIMPGTPGDLGMTLDFNAMAWSAVFAPVLAMAVLQALIHVADVIHPAWSRLRAVASIAVVLTGLWSVWLMAQAQSLYGQLFTVNGPADVAERVAKLDKAFGTVSQVMLYGLAIGFAVALVVEGWRLVRSLQASEEPALSA
ncbi:MAG TPA: hypothetical protein VFV70_05040 [Hyphomonadaceae bacterium]|nr:hypothetical protein [Hyphomonadaceae bacterium]